MMLVQKFEMGEQAVPLSVLHIQPFVTIILTYIFGNITRILNLDVLFH